MVCVMGYIKELEELFYLVTKSEDFNIGQRVMMLELIENRKKKELQSDDFFIRFHEDVTKEDLNFDYETSLGEENYDAASQEAEACINVFASFEEIKANSSLLSWVVNALKFTDILALQYIQDILKEEPINHPDNGVERSRYIQINKAKNRAHVAGRILNNLYDQRNKLEHRTKKDPNDSSKQIILKPDYNKARKKIIKDYPKALKSFKTAYKEHYE